MATPQSAIAKYDSKTTEQRWQAGVQAAGAQAYQSGVQGKGGKYSRNLGRFLGVGVPGVWTQAWEQGTQNAAQDWQQGVSAAVGTGKYSRGIQRAGGGQGWFNAFRNAAMAAGGGGGALT